MQIRKSANMVEVRKILRRVDASSFLSPNPSRFSMVNMPLIFSNVMSTVALFFSIVISICGPLQLSQCLCSVKVSFGFFLVSSEKELNIFCMIISQCSQKFFRKLLEGTEELLFLLLFVVTM